MKKLVSLLVIAVLILSLSGCGTPAKAGVSEEAYNLGDKAIDIADEYLGVIDLIDKNGLSEEMNTGLREKIGEDDYYKIDAVYEKIDAIYEEEDLNGTKTADKTFLLSCGINSLACDILIAWDKPSDESNKAVLESRNFLAKSLGIQEKE